MSSVTSTLLSVSPPSSFLLMTTSTNDSIWGSPNATGDDNGTLTTLPPQIEKTQEDFMLFQVIDFISSYYLWVLLAVGVPGNIASIFTIVSMPTVSSSKAHVAILSLADTWAIILKVTYNQVSLHRYKLTTPGCAIVMFLQQFFTCYVNWVVVAMTIERFVAVWFPLRVGRIYTRRKALYVLGFFATLTSAVYACFFWTFMENHDPDYGYWCSIRMEYGHFFQNTFRWIDAIFCSILPCCFVLTGNMLIIINIRRARRAQRHLTSNYDQRGRTARDQRQITVMLVVVSVVFLLLNMPNAILYIVKIYWDHKVSLEERVKHMFISRFVHTLTDCNHAVNFYLYFLSMSTFRRRFMDAIRCRKSARRRPTGSVYRTSQTYVQGGHLTETSRTEMTSRYIATPQTLMRNGSNADSHHSLKSCSSVNNPRLSIHTDNSSHITANSEV